MADEVDDSWRLDARLFRELDSGEGWPFAACVACSVLRGEGSGKRRERDTSRKVSARAFAKVAGTSADRVLRYLQVWEAAAADDLVPNPSSLVPGSARAVTLPDVPWRIYARRVHRSRAEVQQRALDTLARVAVPTEQLAAVLPEATRADLAAHIIHSGTEMAEQVYTLAEAAIIEARMRLKHQEEEDQDDDLDAEEPDTNHPRVRAERALRLVEQFVKAAIDRPDLDAAHADGLVNIALAMEGLSRLIFEWADSDASESSAEDFGEEEPPHLYAV